MPGNGVDIPFAYRRENLIEFRKTINHSYFGDSRSSGRVTRKNFVGLTGRLNSDSLSFEIGYFLYRTVGAHGYHLPAV